jgi:hypothetical protein
MKKKSTQLRNIYFHTAGSLGVSFADAKTLLLAARNIHLHNSIRDVSRPGVLVLQHAKWCLRNGKEIAERVAKKYGAIVEIGEMEFRHPLFIVFGNKKLPVPKL